MDTSFNQQNNHGIMDDEEGDLSSISSNVSNSSDFMEDASSSSSSSSDHINGSSTTTTTTTTCGGPLYEMATLMQQLPFKRGLSKHFQGKSQSFTSLSNVKSLEDLAKPEKPCKKKMKSCKSYAGGLSESNKASHLTKTCSKTISKKSSSRGSWSSLGVAKRSNSFLGNKPPVPPQRTCSLFNQTPLFA